MTQHGAPTFPEAHKVPVSLPTEPFGWHYTRPSREVVTVAFPHNHKLPETSPLAPVKTSHPARNIRKGDGVIGMSLVSPSEVRLTRRLPSSATDVSVAYRKTRLAGSPIMKKGELLLVFPQNSLPGLVKTGNLKLNEVKLRDGGLEITPRAAERMQTRSSSDYKHALVP